jgi:hypothetical protein
MAIQLVNKGPFISAQFISAHFQIVQSGAVHSGALVQTGAVHSGACSFRRSGSNWCMFIPAHANSGAVHSGALVQTGAVHSGALVQTAAYKKFSFL